MGGHSLPCRAGSLRPHSGTAFVFLFHSLLAAAFAALHLHKVVESLRRGLPATGMSRGKYAVEIIRSVGGQRAGVLQSAQPSFAFAQALFIAGSDGGEERI